MKTKLTLRLEEALIRRAKEHAHRTGRSVSQMVSEYFVLLGGQDPEGEQELPPRVEELRGFLRGSILDEEDYRSYLEEKHR